MVIVTQSFISEENAIAALSTADPRLISIINKSIALLDDKDISNIITAHTTAKPYQFNAVDILYKYRAQLGVCGILLLLCLILLMVITENRRKHLYEMQEKNRQLGEAVAQAENANRAKSQFLSRMIHEIRTPMNAIVGITTIAKVHKNEPDKVEDYLTKIDSSSKLLLNIINDVLDMSAIESEKLKIASNEFDLKQVLTGIFSIYYTQCKAKGIEFVMATDLEKEMVIGDQLRVNQILMNLVSNAFKFTETGGTIQVLVNQT
ncbi:MAG: histidine kinase dimerization/phospho-acceptor domain-containing protein [Lachnospiraceae bacterium]|nr:histidine kinase dimerization/phospho-acceptor domain-containing protein [Lachnospiraceae bacterium]